MDETLNIGNITDEQRKIADVVGVEAYKKLVENFGGSTLYISKADTLSKNDRDMKIRKEFDGGNYRELAKKYCLTDNRIRAILKKRN